jgi:hypothetical protein
MAIHSKGNKVASTNVNINITRDDNGEVTDQYISFSNVGYSNIGPVNLPGTAISYQEGMAYVNEKGEINIAGLYDSDIHISKLVSAGIVIDEYVTPVKEDMPE